MGNTKQELYIIAEIGQNHQGNLFFAKQMVDVLANIPGINAIKTVKRDLSVCLTEEQKRQEYCNIHSFGDTYYNHRKALELSNDDFLDLKLYVKSKGLDFISSFTDIPSFHYLMDIGVKRVKIPSQRVPDIKLLKEVAQTKVPVILSTGMSSMEMVDNAYDILKDQNLWILQASSIYPTQDKDMNLNTIPEYLKRYSCRVGLSSHNIYYLADAIAYIMGGTVFEHHFTLCPALKGRDHQCSFDYEDFRNLYRLFETIETLKGSGEKEILKGEKETIHRLRADL